MMKRVKVIDSHTGGEPTRVIVEGGPDLDGGTMKERLERLRDQHDGLRSGVLREPRGSDILVGVLLSGPSRPDDVAGVIFFNNVGYLGMCGHGTIGVAVTLAHMGRIAPGRHGLDTPAGRVSFTLHDSHSVSVENVPCYRYRKGVEVEVPGQGTVFGDIAWGGNWFFLVSDHNQSLEPARINELTEYCTQIRRQLNAENITGKDGAEIDHIELFGPASDQNAADAKNFVLCPGMAYDRSPCGTGTSAKLACLYADGKLAPGETWRQESIIGSIFEGRLTVRNRAGKEPALIPEITGSAYITGENTLLFDAGDPFATGINIQNSQFREPA